MHKFEIVGSSLPHSTTQDMSTQMILYFRAFFTFTYRLFIVYKCIHDFGGLAFRHNQSTQNSVGPAYIALYKKCIK